MVLLLDIYLIQHLLVLIASVKVSTIIVSILIAKSIIFFDPIQIQDVRKFDKTVFEASLKAFVVLLFVMFIFMRSIIFLETKSLTLQLILFCIPFLIISLIYLKLDISEIEIKKIVKTRIHRYFIFKGTKKRENLFCKILNLVKLYNTILFVTLIILFAIYLPIF